MIFCILMLIILAGIVKIIYLVKSNPDQFLGQIFGTDSEAPWRIRLVTVTMTGTLTCLLAFAGVAPASYAKVVLKIDQPSKLLYIASFMIVLVGVTLHLIAVYIANKMRPDEISPDVSNGNTVQISLTTNM